jgi:hypothetical protein
MISAVGTEGVEVIAADPPELDVTDLASVDRLLTQGFGASEGTSVSTPPVSESTIARMVWVMVVRSSWVSAVGANPCRPPWVRLTMTWRGLFVSAARMRDIWPVTLLALRATCSACRADDAAAGGAASGAPGR